MKSEEMGPLELACIKLRQARVYAEMARDNIDSDMAAQQAAVAEDNTHEALDLLKRVRGVVCPK